MGMEWNDVGQCFIANSPDDFKGWEYLADTFWKTDKDGKDIHTVYIKTPWPSTEMRVVFCEITKENFNKLRSSKNE